MNSNDLQTLIACRLEDMTAQVERLYADGDFAEAELLRDEGLALAKSFDNEDTFVFLNDLTAI